MAGEQIWLLTSAGAAVALLLWGWRRFDIAAWRDTPDKTRPEEPGWTEEIASDGRHVYGRAGGFNEELAEADALARWRGSDVSG